MLEIYAEFDSLKQSQVALRADSTNLRIIQAKAEKRKSVKVRKGFLRLFLDANCSSFKDIGSYLQKRESFNAKTQRRKDAKIFRTAFVRNYHNNRLSQTKYIYFAALRLCVFALN